MRMLRTLLALGLLLVAPLSASAQQCPANFVMASPNGSAGLTKCRALVSNDIPDPLSIGALILEGATSGTTTLQASSIASGTITVPAATDTLVGKATADTLTNKTFNTAGSGNVFQINGTGIASVTGTGSAVLANSPTFTGTPAAPTAAAGTNTTQLATTAFVQQEKNVVATITALKALSTTTAAVLANVYVAGYTTVGDAGAGWFIWNSGSSASDNSCTIIIPNSAPGTGRWIRTLDDPATISVAQCGGFVALADIGASITLAIAALPSTGGTVLIPGAASNYAITTTVVVPNFVTLKGTRAIKGSGAGPTDIRYNGTAARLFDLRDTNGATIDGLFIVAANAGFTGIMVDAGSTAAGTKISSNIRILNSSFVVTSAQPICVNVNRALSWIIENNLFSGHCTPAIQGATDTGIALQSTTGTIHKNIFINNLNWPITCGGDMWVIEENVFEPNSDGVPTIFSDCTNIIFNNLVISNNWTGDASAGGALIFLNAGGEKITVKDNQLQGIGTGTNGWGVLIDTVAPKSITIEGNVVNAIKWFIQNATATTTIAGTIHGNHSMSAAAVCTLGSLAGANLSKLGNDNFGGGAC